MIYEWTLAVASVYFLCIKGDGHMMIVRIKTPTDADTQNLVRERIKQQISEGLVVHDNSVEITFADDFVEYDEEGLEIDKSTPLVTKHFTEAENHLQDLGVRVFDNQGELRSISDIMKDLKESYLQIQESVKE